MKQELGLSHSHVIRSNTGMQRKGTKLWPPWSCLWGIDFQLLIRKQNTQNSKRSAPGGPEDATFAESALSVDAEQGFTGACQPDTPGPTVSQSPSGGFSRHVCAALPQLVEAPTLASEI